VALQLRNWAPLEIAGIAVGVGMKVHSSSIGVLQSAVVRQGGVGGPVPVSGRAVPASRGLVRGHSGL